MIFSFPIDAWLLLLVAIGLGLTLEVVFYRRRRASRNGSTPRVGTPSPHPREDDAAGSDA